MYSYNHSQRFSSALVLFICLSNFVFSLDQTFCSSENTGSSFTPEQYIYQSLGHCQTTCGTAYAYAITQGSQCWCSNTTPSPQLQLTACNTACPGFPFEFCGSTDANRFSYFALGPSPSGASSSSISSSSSTTSVSTSTRDSSSSSSSSSPIITSQSIYTSGGLVITKTVTSSPSSTSASNNEMPTKSKLSTGSIVAIAVSVVVASIIILAAILVGFCCWKRRKQAEDLDEPGTNLNRNTSVLSKSGLLGNSSGSPHSESARSGTMMSERRNSRLQIYDQRLNPNAFMQHEDNSRTSFVSMQDNQDYTRTLNVRNPDPTE